MSIRCQGIDDLEFAHQDEAGTVSKRIVVVRMFAEKGFRRLEAFGRHPFHDNRLGLFDALHQRQRHCRVRARLGERDGLIDDVISGDNTTLGSKEPRESTDRRRVRPVSPGGKRKKERRIRKSWLRSGSDPINNPVHFSVGHLFNRPIVTPLVQAQ